MNPLGILCAVAAFLLWGVGDFFIQRTSRHFGVWSSTFCITIFGAIVFLPFAYPHFGELFGSGTWFLLALGGGTLLAGLATFSALKQGKIAVIEPVLSFELPLTVLVSVLFIRETMGNIQMLLVAFVFGGILLIGYTGTLQTKRFLEKGALIALVAALLQAFVNVGTGLASRGLGPIETMWFVDTFVACICIVYFTVTGSWRTLGRNVREHLGESVAVAVLDNGAWIAYATAMTLIPISLASAVSEAYIILSILLGVVINREKLLAHQWIGIAIALGAVIVLAAIS